MDWWISPAGAITGPAPASQRISYEANHYRGPYPSRAAARAAVGGVPAPAPPAGPVSGSGQWWVIQVSALAPRSAGTSSYKIVESSAPAGPSGTSGGLPITQTWGPFKTEAEAQKRLTSLESVSGPNFPNPLHGIDAIGAFFAKLGDRATWVRIVKVAIGAIMIIAGLAKMGAPAAEKIAAKLPKVLPV